MGMYRKEWSCCNSATETDAWEPQDCPFCAPQPQRTWVYLTDEEIDVIDEATWDEDDRSWGIHDFARAIEAKSNEKNHG